MGLAFGSTFMYTSLCDIHGDDDEEEADDDHDDDDRHDALDMQSYPGLLI